MAADPTGRGAGRVTTSPVIHQAGIDGTETARAADAAIAAVASMSPGSRRVMDGAALLSDGPAGTAGTAGTAIAAGAAVAARHFGLTYRSA